MVCSEKPPKSADLSLSRSCYVATDLVHVEDFTHSISTAPITCSWLWPKNSSVIFSQAAVNQRKSGFDCIPPFLPIGPLSVATPIQNFLLQVSSTTFSQTFSASLVSDPIFEAECSNNPNPTPYACPMTLPLPPVGVKFVLPLPIYDPACVSNSSVTCKGWPGTGLPPSCSDYQFVLDIISTPQCIPSPACHNQCILNSCLAWANYVNTTEVTYIPYSQCFIEGVLTQPSCSS